jgi:nitrite reductase (NADH) large subunit
VIHDGLGIAQELEAELEQLIRSYKCEWKEAVESPEIRGRYTHYLNSDETDSNIEFVALREQKMPRAWP